MSATVVLWLLAIGFATPAVIGGLIQHRQERERDPRRTSVRLGRTPHHHRLRHPARPPRPQGDLTDAFGGEIDENPYPPEIGL